MGRRFDPLGVLGEVWVVVPIHNSSSRGSIVSVYPSLSGCSILPLRLHVYRSLGAFSLVGTGSVLCGISILCLYVRLCVGVGAARPGPVQLYYSVDLHSKLYMLVFTFCFSNKIPWSNILSGLYFRASTPPGCVADTGKGRWRIRSRIAVDAGDPS